MKKLRAYLYPIYRFWIHYRSRNSDLINFVTGYNDFFFQNLGVDKAEAIKLYKEIMESISLPISPNDSMHGVLFAGLKLSDWRPKTILELGTFMGETAAYLAALFPDSHLYTINLSPDDPLYAKMHPGEPKENRKVLSQRLSKPRVNISETNTLWLMLQDMPDFDLIWLDAGHEYPEVAWDHFFCIQKLKPNGWLFTDDLKLAQEGETLLIDPAGSDINHVITYINQRLKNPFQWVLKRENVADFLMRPKGIGFLNAKANKIGSV